MAAPVPHLTDLELFLLTVPDDTEDAPWMVMADLQVRAVDILKASLRLHARRHHLRWYIASYLKIVTTRPHTGRPLEAAPDLLVAVADDRLRRSWTIRRESKAPEFVLEVSSDKSWERDSEDKPPIYGAMGVLEYAVFAPERTDGGPSLFGYRRSETGQFLPWATDERGVLWCHTLGGLGLAAEDQIWLRALDANGQPLPTPEELIEAEAEAHQQAREAWAAERARREGELAQRDADLAQRAAELAQRDAELARLRAELRRLRERGEIDRGRGEPS